MFAAKGNRGNDVFDVARNDDADGDLAVVGGVHGVEGAAAAVETDFAAQMAAQGCVEGVGVDGGRFGRSGKLG